MLGFYADSAVGRVIAPPDLPAGGDDLQSAFDATAKDAVSGEIEVDQARIQAAGGAELQALVERRPR